jgi:hypothetical protein
VSWKEYHAWRSRLMEELDAAFASSRLPDVPDRRCAGAFLLKPRRGMVE